MTTLPFTQVFTPGGERDTFQIGLLPYCSAGSSCRLGSGLGGSRLPAPAGPRPAGTLLRPRSWCHHLGEAESGKSQGKYARGYEPETHTHMHARRHTHTHTHTNRFSKHRFNGKLFPVVTFSVKHHNHDSFYSTLNMA